MSAFAKQRESGHKESIRRERDQRERGRLREFQEQLLDRMNAARKQGFSHESRLGVFVAGRRCLADLREIDEIVQPMPITPVPLTKDWYLGLANIRGSLVSIIDLDRFCGAPQQERGTDSRVIVLRALHSGRCGFLVSGVLGLRYLQEMTLADPAKQSTAQWPFMHTYHDRDMCAWIEISFAALIDDARFLHVAL